MYTPIEQIHHLRNAVTHLHSGTDDEKSAKLKKYVEIYTLCRDSGYFNQMVEVSAFANGGRISKEDYEVCMEAALTRKDIASFVYCKKVLGRKVAAAEYWAVSQSIPSLEKRLCILHSIIKQHVPQWKLTPQELLIAELTVWEPQQHIHN